MNDSIFHPVAGLFPLMQGHEFDALVDDIKQNGLREPIWRHEGKIIDGRNRYRACMEAGVDPVYREWGGKGSLLDFVVSQNLHRRHLDASQRAMIAAKIANVPVGVAVSKLKKDVAVDSVERPLITVAFAAKTMRVSHEIVAQARAVRAKGDPELVEAVEDGRITLNSAEKLLKEPSTRQKQIAAAARVVKGRRLSIPAPKAESKSEPMESKSEVKFTINTDDPASAAAMLAERLDAEFLERLADALSALVQRRKAARERGLAPVAKGK